MLMIEGNIPCLFEGKTCSFRRALTRTKAGVIRRDVLGLQYEVQYSEMDIASTAGRRRVGKSVIGEVSVPE